MGAIHGIHFSGFIGALYRRYPFPARPEEFKQRPDGACSQAEAAALVAQFGRAITIAVEADPEQLEIALGNYRFDREGFGALIDYVWRGGYPRWQDERRPQCVLAMKEEVLRSECWLFPSRSS